MVRLKVGAWAEEEGLLRKAASGVVEAVGRETKLEEEEVEVELHQILEAVGLVWRSWEAKEVVLEDQSLRLAQVRVEGEVAAFQRPQRSRLGKTNLWEAAAEGHQLLLEEVAAQKGCACLRKGAAR